MATSRTDGAVATDLYKLAMPSPVGQLTLVGSRRGLRAVLWETERPGRVALPAALADHSAGSSAPPVLADTVAQLSEYFAGERRQFELPLDLVGTPFQQQAWRALAAIPYGSTVSYGQQAERLGRPRSARAIGAANGRNPLSIVLPCHRVLGANGSLTGFAGGLAAKRFLLNLEGLAC